MTYAIALAQVVCCDTFAVTKGYPTESFAGNV